MSHRFRILVPVGLFVAFGLTHMMATRSDLIPHEIAVAKVNLTKGKRIQPEQLEPVTVFVQSSSKTLEKSFVSYGSRGVDLLYRPLNRNIQQGELISLADLLPESGNAPPLAEGEIGIQVPLPGVEFSASQLKIGSNIGFVVERSKETAGKDSIVGPLLLQPFRLVGVGDVVTPVRDTGGKDESKNARVLTIAVKLQDQDSIDPKTSLLLRAASARDSLRIINVVVLPESRAGKDIQ